MKSYKFLVLIVTGCMVASCARYLDVKPNQSLATPTTVQGLQALLDNERYIAQGYPTSGDLASDYFYLSDADWAALGMEYDRDTYIWQEHGMLNTEWRAEFERILVFNVILSEVDDADLEGTSEHDRSRVKGSAHFFRGWRYLQLAQVFAPHYQPGVNDGDWGLPIRTDPDINIPTIRNTLSETYGLIIDDLQQAAHHLPANLVTPTRPSKATAYAALARVHLILGMWEDAYQYADSCLQLHDDLMDYNTIDYQSNIPFPLFNPEVLLHTTILSSSAPFNPARAKVDTVLFNSYSELDLRKVLFYAESPDGSHAFRGSYSGNPTSALLFSGLATDEVYLTKAEAAARLDREAEALVALNNFLLTRYVKGWETFNAADFSGERLLRLILEEREKSLAFRAGIRWSDLRRLNTEERFAKTLVRVLDGERYTLPPNDPRYTFLIPTEIIQLTGMPQNRR